MNPEIFDAGEIRSLQNSKEKCNINSEWTRWDLNPWPLRLLRYSTFASEAIYRADLLARMPVKSDWFYL